MIFDISQILPDDQGIDTVRFKPRNKAVCTGILTYQGEDVASIKTLAVLYHSYDGGVVDTELISGRFELEWYRSNREIQFFTEDIGIFVQYGEGKPPVMLSGWTIPAIAIIEDGVPLAIGSLKDLMGGENIFFAKRLIVHNYAEELALNLQDIKERFSNESLQLPV